MTYEPPLHVAAMNVSTLISDKDCAFIVEAGRIQMERDIAPMWGIKPPGIALYSKDAEFPSSLAMMALFVDDDGVDDAAGLHGSIAGTPYVLIDVRQSKRPSRTFSHELEACINKHLDRWVPGPLGRDYALENADPTQEHGYDIQVELFGERRPIQVSNFVGPAWFGMGKGPLDHMGICIDAFEILPGAYAIARSGRDVIFLSGPDGAVMAARTFAPWSRASRIVRSVERVAA